MLEFLTLLTLFAQPVFYCILAIFGITVESGQMGVLFIIIAIIGYLYVFKENLLAKKIKLKFLVLIGIIIIILALCFITVLSNGSMDQEFRGQFLSFGSASIVACLLGYTLSQKDRLKRMGRWIPVFVIVLTLVTFITTMTSEDTTSGGQIASSAGLIYQNISYYAAYAFGLNMYFIMNINKLETFKWIKKIRFIFPILASIEAITVLLGGGRGGFVLFLILCAYFLFLNFKEIAHNPNKFLDLFLVLIGVAVVIAVLEITDFEKVGLERILNFIDNAQDANRADLQEKAIQNFNASPIIGNGIGSVFYLIGIYSHNMFTDFLCDTGVIGTALLIITLAVYFVKQRMQIKRDPLNRIILVIFIFGFTMSMFSGYYMSQQMLWFSVSFVLTCGRKRLGNQSSEGLCTK